MAQRRDDGTSPHDPGYPPRLCEFMRSSWRDAALEVTVRPAAPNHAARRAALSAVFPGETLVVPSGRQKVRANDTHHAVRPGSAHAWLTGCYDPDSVLVMRPASGGHEARLYLRPRSSRDTDEFFKDRVYGELWIGRRRTLAESAAELGIATADLGGLEAVLDDCAPGHTRVLRGVDPLVDVAIRPAGLGERDAGLATALAELRLVKDDWEIAQLQEAVDATVRGFEDVARVLPSDRPVRERLLEGVFALRARHDGNDVGYSSIVGAGRNASTLHWTRNDGATRPGELLLMDMGVENEHLYTADVTRVLPVSGIFTPVQREVYDLVHRAQQAGIDVIKPGVVFSEMYDACVRVLTEGLHDLGMLPGGVEEALDPQSMLHRRWTLHGSGHMLGIDVHDCVQARTELYKDGPLVEGYVLTVEPGLYFQPEDELVPVELRGVGIRIEDDVLVTADGPVVMSAGLPRTAAAVEGWLAEQRAAGPRLPG